MTAVATREDPLLRAMPAVFVLIWATGFIVARYGMPHAPPMKFLALRYALSVACFLLWALLARAAWPRGAAQYGHLAVTGFLMHALYLGGVWGAVKLGMGAMDAGHGAARNPLAWGERDAAPGHQFEQESGRADRAVRSLDHGDAA